MVFQVSIGFSGLTNSDAKEDDGKTYALFIGDTVIINKVSFMSNRFLTLLKSLCAIIFLKGRRRCFCVDASKKEN